MRTALTWSLSVDFFSSALHCGQYPALDGIASRRDADEYLRLARSVLGDLVVDLVVGLVVGRLLSGGLHGIRHVGS